MTGLRIALALITVGVTVACRESEEPLPDCGQGRICNCAPGDDSPDCNPCKVGYRPALSGSSCVPTCSAPEIACGQYGTCEDTASGAQCSCDPGHTGSDCTRCEPDLTPNANGRCVARLSAPALLTLSVVGEQRMLGSIVPPSWSFLPLAPVPATVTDVAYEQGSDQIYALDGGRLSRIELSTGELTPLSETGVDLGSALCLDPGERRALTASAAAIHAVDLESLAVTQLASVGARAIEYDSSRGRVVGVDMNGSSFELSSGGMDNLGPAPELGSLAMAFDPQIARAYFTGNQPESAGDRLLRYCTATLTRFGAVPAWPTSVVLDPEQTQAAPVVVNHDGTDAALVALNLTDTAFDTVRIQVGHPQAAVCIVDERSSTTPLQVQWVASAAAAFTLIAAPGRPVSLDASDLNGDASIHVYTDPGLSVSGSSDGITKYDDQAWSALSLSSLSELPPRATTTLVLMDWASRAMLPLELPNPSVGGALAWVGVAP